MRVTAVILAAILAGCTTKTETRDTTAAPQGADPDVAASGTGIPSGYTAVTDDAAAQLTSIRYDAKDGAWEVTTGPAHIIFAAKDTARGTYTASATFAQLEAPRHPEAYGIFVGGRDLQGEGRTYTYFIVRGTGEYAIKSRAGGKVQNVVDWRANPALPKQDGSGQATYRLAIRSGADSVRFLVNETQVAAVKAGAVATDGIAGVRVNHNLHVRTAPISISR